MRAGTLPSIPTRLAMKRPSRTPGLDRLRYWVAFETDAPRTLGVKEWGSQWALEWQTENPDLTCGQSVCRNSRLNPRKAGGRLWYHLAHADS